ncbi:LysR family substrate-binding domain-containing protein [Cellulomonas soli]|uniref:LysR family substrate-binding domain-containing protein n=1 Tax=Cellulomonas soli TaxID=931535 RepID=UPI003F832D83
MNQPASTLPSSFRLLLVPGVNPDRWLRVWAERLPDHPVELVHAEPRDQLAVLHEGRADAGLVRLPTDRTGLQVVELWTERTVVVVPDDHVLTVVEEVDPADLADETLLVPADDLIGWSDAPGRPFAGEAPATTADALDLVAAGTGVLLLPQSLARLHHRKDLTYRPVRDAPQTSVGLAWLRWQDDDLVQELVGIVRGRTAGSSRGRGEQPPARSTAQPPRTVTRSRGSGERSKASRPRRGHRSGG